MAKRTTQVIARFSEPFELPGVDKPQPAGDYRIDHDEESVEGVSWIAWRRVGSFIHLPGIGVRSSTRQMAPIDAADLKGVIEKDAST